MARAKCPRGMKAVSVCVPDVQQGPAPKTARALRGLGGMECPHCGGWAEKHPAINTHVCQRCAAQRDAETGQWHRISPRWSADSKEKILPDARPGYTLEAHSIVQQRARRKGTSHMGGITGNVLTQPATKWADSGKSEGGHWVMDPAKGTGSLALVGSTFQLSFDGEVLKTYESYTDLMKHLDRSGQFHIADPGRFWSHEPSIQFSNMGEVMGWFDQMMEAGQIGRLQGLGHVSGLGAHSWVGAVGEVALRACTLSGELMQTRVMARVELFLPTKRSRVHRTPVLQFSARVGALIPMPDRDSAEQGLAPVLLTDINKPFKMELQSRGWGHPTTKRYSYHSWRVEDPAALMVLVDAAMEKTGGSFSGLAGKPQFRVGADGVGPFFEVDGNTAHWRVIENWVPGTWEKPETKMLVRAMASRDGWKQKNILRINFAAHHGPISSDVDLNTAKEGLAHHDGFEGRTHSWSVRATTIGFKFDASISQAMQVWLDQLETDRGFSDVAHGAPLMGLGARERWRFEQSRPITRAHVYGGGKTTYEWYPVGKVYASRLDALRDWISQMEAEPSMAQRNLPNLQRIWNKMSKFTGARLVRVPPETKLGGLGALRTADGDILQLHADDLEVRQATVAPNGNRTHPRSHLDIAHFNVVASPDRDTLHFFPVLTEVGNPNGKPYYAFTIEISSKDALEGMERMQGFGTTNLIHIPVMLNKKGKEALLIWLDEQRERGRLVGGERPLGAINFDQLEWQYASATPRQDLKGPQFLISGPADVTWVRTNNGKRQVVKLTITNLSGTGLRWSGGSYFELIGTDGTVAEGKGRRAAMGSYSVSELQKLASTGKLKLNIRSGMTLTIDKADAGQLAVKLDEWLTSGAIRP